MDNVNWCPDCGEPREKCMSDGLCKTGREAKAYQLNRATHFVRLNVQIIWEDEKKLSKEIMIQ